MFDLSHITLHLSHITFDLPQIMLHVQQIMDELSLVTLDGDQTAFHLHHIKHHLPRITFHLSHIKRYLPRITSHLAQIECNVPRIERYLLLAHPPHPGPLDNTLPSGLRNYLQLTGDPLLSGVRSVSTESETILHHTDKYGSMITEIR